MLVALKLMVTVSAPTVTLEGVVRHSVDPRQVMGMA